MHLFTPTQTNSSHRAPHFCSWHRAVVAAAAAVVFLGAVGCNGDAPLAPGAGTGSLTSTGAVSVSASGIAIFQSVSSGGASLFQVVIAPVTQSANIWTLQIANYTGRLAPGTYNLLPLSGSSTNPTATLSYITGGASGTSQLFNSTSGQLVITASSQSEVDGTFSFPATDLGGTSSVTVNGSFKARCAPGTVCQ